MFYCMIKAAELEAARDSYLEVNDRNAQAKFGYHILFMDKPFGKSDSSRFVVVYLLV